ncbi:MAG: DMT family transporter [Sphaerochaetaceae bacterium]|jgi:drug/metabolite transporter (DMT)-like permease
MEHSRKSGETKTLIKLFLAPVIWGGALSAGRIVSAELPAFTTSFIRFLLASAFMVPILAIKNKGLPKVSKKGWIWVFLLSLTGVVIFNVTLFTALETITAVRSSVMLAFTPAVVTLIAWILFKEKLNLPMIVGVIMAIIGAVLTITDGNFKHLIQSGIAVGDWYMLAAVLAWAVYSIIIRYAVLFLKPLELLTYGSVMGVILLLPFTIAEGSLSLIPSLSPAAIGSLVYLSVGAAGIAYLWYYEGIAVVGSTKASVFLNMEPIAAIFLGIFLLGEKLSVPVAIGALLVIGGLFVTNYTKKK